MTHSLHAQWEPSKEALRDILSPEDAESWLGGLRLAQLSPERAVLEGVPNAFFHKRIARHFAPLLRDSLRHAFPEQSLPGEFELQLCVRGAEPSLAPGASIPADVAPIATPGFDRFHAGEENRIPVSLALQVAQDPGSRYNPFFLTGASGCGKSHLLGAITETLAAQHPAWRIVQESAEGFTSRVLEAMRERRMPALRQHYRGADALLLDDLHFVEVSAKAQEELLYTFEALHAAGKQMVFASERPPSALAGLSEGLRSRLETALVAELQPPGLEARHAIVRAVAARERVALDEADMAWLALRVTGNPRRLEGAVRRIAAYSGAAGQPLGSSYVRELAAPWVEPDAGNHVPPAPNTVLETICAEFNLTAKQLRARERSPQRDRARQFAMLLLRDVCGLSFGEIGRLVGNRANSTVLEGIAALRHRLTGDRALAAFRERMMSQVRRQRPWNAANRIISRTEIASEFKTISRGLH